MMMMILIISLSAIELPRRPWEDASKVMQCGLMLLLLTLIRDLFFFLRLPSAAASSLDWTKDLDSLLILLYHLQDLILV